MLINLADNIKLREVVNTSNIERFKIINRLENWKEGTTCVSRGRNVHSTFRQEKSDAKT